jgi:hypothetical protein
VGSSKLPPIDLQDLQHRWDLISSNFFDIFRYTINFAQLKKKLKLLPLFLFLLNTNYLLKWSLFLFS